MDSTAINDGPRVVLKHADESQERSRGRLGGGVAISPCDVQLPRSVLAEACSKGRTYAPIPKAIAVEMPPVALGYIEGLSRKPLVTCPVSVHR
jgi:hypothetical protein